MPPKKKAKKSLNKAAEGTITLNEWFDACTKYEEILKVHPHYSKSKFLQSNDSGDKLDQTKKSAFGRYWKKFQDGDLKPSNLTRQRKTKYPQIEAQLIQYIDARAQNYKRDKCGISFTLLRQKCNQWANAANIKDWQASNGWIADALERAGRVSINLHGEANEMTDEEIVLIMTPWIDDFHKLLSEKGIKPACCYNADQTGLYYQKLPNTLYIDVEEKKEVSIDLDDIIYYVYCTCA